MAYTVRHISEALGAPFEGDGDILHRRREPLHCTSDDIALALKEEYAEGLKGGAARVAVLWAGADWQSYGLQAAILHHGQGLL